MLIKELRTIITSGLFFFALASQGNALVVYNNLNPGPGNPYDPNMGWGFGPSSSVSMQFAATGSGYFSQLTIAAGNFFDSTMTVQLRADNGNVGPGVVLETLSFLVEDRFGQGGLQLQVIAAAGTTLVSDQTWYWLTVQSASNFGWYYNNTGVTGYTISNANFGNPTVQTLGAFQIEVADPVTVPEPNTLALLSCALFLGLLRRTRGVAEE